jgi:MFS transporter, SP family, sugar:H+ symporter
MRYGHVTLLAIGSAVGGLLFGFDTSTMNAAIVGIKESLALSSASVGFLAAISLIGCALGAWFAGPSASRRGRTRVMLVAGLLVAAGTVGVGSSGNLILMGICRFTIGIGIGAASAVVPGYIVEIAPTEIRGRLGTFWQFAIVIGQFAGLLSGYLLTQLAGTESAPLLWGAPAWRWMFLVSAIPAAAWVLIVRTLPPTPQDTSARRGKLSELRGPRLGLQPIVWTGLLLAALQQLVGISVVKTYSNTIWQAVGFSTKSAFTISLITVAISILSTVVAIMIMDRIGRRIMLSAGAAVMAFALAGLAFAFSTATGSGEALSVGPTAGLSALIAINLFAVAFGITWGPIVWLMLNELFDTRHRTTAVAVCTAVNWLTNWLVVRTFPLLADVGLGVAYALFAACAALAFVFAWRVLPETRGEDLEQTAADRQITEPRVRPPTRHRRLSTR